MAARTALTPLVGVLDGGVAQGAGATPDASNGNTVASPGPYKILVIVKNADASSHTVTLRATGSGNTAAGATQTSPYPSSGVYAQGSVGDLVITVVNATTQIIGPLTTDRFAQADGSLSLDWSSSTSMTVWVLQLPYNAI
jgi:hypothetical protein